jgi:hypothetical protein
MSDLCGLIWCAGIGVFRSRAALEAENLVLRHQLNVPRRKCPKRMARAASGHAAAAPISVMNSRRLKESLQL